MLRVIQPGLFSTVQDQGRPGFRAFGVPVAGVFDRFSAAIANALVGNPPSAAVVEITIRGGVYEAETPLAIAVAGAPLASRIQTSGQPDRRLVFPQSASLKPGDRLVIEAGPTGARAYLAVRGGWRSPRILGSQSTDRPLVAEDLLVADRGWIPVRRLRENTLPANLPPIRFIDGPDARRLRGSLEERDYEVETSSNRMGLRLKGLPLDLEIDPARLSSPVSPGAIQIAGGLPLILGPDCGTMGGYPLVGHVIHADLDRIGQSRPGDTIRFRRVSLLDARRLAVDYEQHLKSWILRLTSFETGGNGDSGLLDFSG